MKKKDFYVTIGFAGVCFGGALMVRSCMTRPEPKKLPLPETTPAQIVTDNIELPPWRMKGETQEVYEERCRKGRAEREAWSKKSRQPDRLDDILSGKVKPKFYADGSPIEEDMTSRTKE